MNSRIYDELKEIVNDVLGREGKVVEEKADGTIVTSKDLVIEAEVISYFRKKSQNLIVIAEESFEGIKSWDLSVADYLILDPIDGTENYAFLHSMYGFAASWRIAGIEGDMIYIPSEDLLFKCEEQTAAEVCLSNIRLFSTKCLDVEIGPNRDSVRIFGSSSYMFSLILRGQAKSYVYCKGAKIWDCYTGLKLCRSQGLHIEGLPDDYFVKPMFKQKFKVSWI